MDNLFYSQKISDVLTQFNSSEQGLGDEEVELRTAKFGLNKLPDAKFDSFFLIFLRQFQSPLIYILLLASVVVFFLREFTDGFIIIFVLVFNAIVGTIQEGRAQNTLRALKKFASTNATVIRDGKEKIIPDLEVVPGDIVVLREGDKIPADCRIFDSHNLTVDESALTGESIPVNKTSEVLSGPDLQLAEQKNMVFKGTHIVAGNGLAVVVATGLKSELGRISSEIAHIDTEIPLKANIRYLTRLIIATVGIICFSIFILGIWLGHSAKEMFATVVSLSVSIIPEGLPVVMTLVLATGVWRMSKRNALVKKLQAVEALGQADVIAVDKTGTLTENQIVLTSAFVNGKTYEIRGEGYNPEGEVYFQGKEVEIASHPDLNLMGRLASFGASSSTVFNEESKLWEASGDPTGSAMSVFATKLGFKKTDLVKDSPKLSEIPFDYRNKFRAEVNKVEGKPFLTVIGAPEKLLSLSENIWHEGKKIALTTEKKKYLEEKLTELSKEGLRVLAVATRKDSPDEIKVKDVSGLTFVGFFGLKDTLRPEVYEAMEKAISAGLKVVMITGDHKLTAEAIAKEAGIFKNGDTILTGEDLDSLSETELSEMIEGVSVFARVTPEHKLKIVQAYKKRGNIVAMTGDGVNDAPSLVAADLGVGMGKIGTEVAKEVSDIVLLDDNFSSIIAAIEEGRSIYKTIKKVILYLFSTSFGEVFTITGALFLSFPLPILPAQIVWLNFVTDGFLDVSLAMEPKEEGLLKGTFERPTKYLLDWLSVQRMFLMALPMTLGSLFLFNRYYLIDLEKAWTVTLTVLAVFQWFNAWNCRHETKSIFRLNPFSNKYLIGATLTVIVLQLLAIYNPLLQEILHTKPLDLIDWIVIIPVASTIIIVEEIRKLIVLKFK